MHILPSETRCLSHFCLLGTRLVLLPRRFGLCVDDGFDELVDYLATRLLAQVLDLLDLGICILLRIFLGLLVA